MNCKIKSNLKLKSNIVLTSKFDRYKSIPFDMLEKTHKDVRMFGQLTQYQRNEQEKILFFADKVTTSKERFSEQEDNKEMCNNCIYKDICI
ncbi:MAG: hypothetical protein R3Y64_10555 [Peptostreptococcaceae bacterium]